MVSININNYEYTRSKVIHQLYKSRRTNSLVGSEEYGVRVVIVPASTRLCSETFEVTIFSSLLASTTRE